MAVSASWQITFDHVRAWADEPGALLFPVETEYGVTFIYPEEVRLRDEELLDLIERRARGEIA